MIAVGTPPTADALSAGVTSGTMTVEAATGELTASALTMFLFSAIVGAMVVTGDNRSKMAGRIQRLTTVEGLIAAKGIAAAAVGALAGVLAAGTAIAVTWLSLKNLGHGFELAGNPVAFVARHGLHAALGGVWGVALGCLLRSTAAVVVFQLAYQPLVENWVVNHRPDIGRWLPGGAESAVVGDPTLAAKLGFLAGLAVLVGWIVALLAAASAATRARLVR
jgi:hypothetical protein